ncbi:serine carboxypeptidase-like 17 isoform X2 [Lycium barbarum]|uniref:serine carboxypeptidase-like 17 isoform X2 n=1 Tax=Lycium barbarum TaxID=112863 RepID=UPI00293F2E49|nr:serine carboxypeptidase-like 17 isoform X2 [Lycium barbarum]
MYNSVLSVINFVLLFQLLNISISHSTIIEFLPGFEGRLPFHLETGYIGVGENEEVQLFYYFLKSESEPTKDPIMLWLSGGPGCSSFTAFVYQIGPLYFEPQVYNGSLPKLTLNPNSWTKSLEENCNKEEDLRYVDPRNVLCYQHYQTFEQLISGINKAHILEPSCGSDSETQSSFQLYGERRSLDEKYSTSLEFGSKCRVEVHRLSTYWANDPKVQEALNVRQGTIARWTRCRKSIVNKTYTITFLDSIPYHVELSKKNIPSLIYSGDHDMNMPFQSTQFWIKSLNYSVIDNWRPWSVEGQVAGYTRSYSNQMTFATVKGAGHVAPEYKPKESLTMFQRWISNQLL